MCTRIEPMCDIMKNTARIQSTGICIPHQAGDLRNGSGKLADSPGDCGTVGNNGTDTWLLVCEARV